MVKDFNFIDEKVGLTPYQGFGLIDTARNPIGECNPGLKKAIDYLVNKDFPNAVIDMSGFGVAKKEDIACLTNLFLYTLSKEKEGYRKRINLGILVNQNTKTFAALKNSAELMKMITLYSKIDECHKQLSGAQYTMKPLFE